MLVSTLTGLRGVKCAEGWIRKRNKQEKEEKMKPRVKNRKEEMWVSGGEREKEMEWRRELEIEEEFSAWLLGPDHVWNLLWTPGGVQSPVNWSNEEINTKVQKKKWGKKWGNGRRREMDLWDTLQQYSWSIPLVHKAVMFNVYREPENSSSKYGNYLRLCFL